MLTTAGCCLYLSRAAPELGQGLPVPGIWDAKCCFSLTPRCGNHRLCCCCSNDSLDPQGEWGARRNTPLFAPPLQKPALHEILYLTVVFSINRVSLQPPQRVSFSTLQFSRHYSRCFFLTWALDWGSPIASCLCRIRLTLFENQNNFR